MRTLLVYALLAAVLATSAAAGAFYSPKTALADTTTPASNLPPKTRMPVLTIAMNQINDIRDMTFSDWKTSYQKTKMNPRYAWMDWSNDGCSGPDWARGVKKYADRAYTAACLRHDYTWRTLAVIDQGTGRIWNERNRWVADETFKQDAFAGCEATYTRLVDWPNESKLGCKIAVSAAYTAIRAWLYNPNRNNAEEVSTKAKPTEYIPFPSATASVECETAGTANRCLPIHYLEVNGRPFIPRNTPYIAQSRVIKMYAVRANLQAPDGPPVRTTGQSLGDYEATGELAIKVNWPLRASTVESSAVCPSEPGIQGEQTVYVRYSNYVPGVTPPDKDDTLKKVPFYVISCANTTDEEEESELLKFNRIEAASIPFSGRFVTQIGEQVRTYEQIHSETCPTRTTAGFTENQANRITLSDAGEGYSYGSWTSTDCEYPNTTFHPYIDYHVFTPEEITKAVIDLEYRGEPVDPELYLYRINKYTGTLGILDAGSDNGDGNSKNARVTQTLYPGTEYVAGATLEGNGNVGDYRLRIGTTPACVINPIDRQPSQTSKYIPGEWTTMDCISSRRANSYADHYMFELGGTTNQRVTTEVWSPDGNPYIFLIQGDNLEGSGYLYKNINNPSYMNHSTITASLAPGPYILVVSTYGEHKTGEYAVRISGLDRGR